MFVSIFFLIFLGIVVTCYFCAPSKWRAGLLLIASYVFCGYLSMRALMILIAISVITYLTGIVLERIVAEEGKRRISAFLLAFAVGGCLVLLGICKYISHMPIGLSFYLFQAIGYLVDINRKKSRAEKNYIYFGLYFAFFAKFVSGPIEREDSFIAQVKELDKVKFFDRGRLSTAFAYMLWGYFMKMTVADRLAVMVAKIFDAPASFDSVWLFGGALFYTIQIYCDFAGYSYIAIGCARIFGIRLTHNFRAPYLAENIADFWRRWHVSLSSWLRDYLYIPLGGNRRGSVRKYINTLIVFLICGMWHGSGKNFIVWGLLHGFYCIVNSFWHTWKGKTNIGFLKAVGADKRTGMVISRGITFLSVMFAWIFFRSSGLKSALIYVKEMFTAGFCHGQYALWMQQTGITGMELCIGLSGALITGIVDWFCNQRKEHFPEWIQHSSNVIRYAVFNLLIIAIFIFGMYGPGYQEADFIYMQF